MMKGGREEGRKERRGGRAEEVGGFESFDESRGRKQGGK